MSAPIARTSLWKWSVCGMLLLATMLNYMDRQTLAQTISVIKPELHLDDAQYGLLEKSFGFAFAIGGLTIGLLADKVNVYYLYPIVLLFWSLAGYSTAYAMEIGTWLGGQSEGERAFIGFRACRIALGYFEAGQWPCALITTSRLLSREERSLGNSILQSGAAVGAIFTPLIVERMVTPEAGTWRLPFQTIGLIGMVWILPWLFLLRPRDLSTTPTSLSKESNSKDAISILPSAIFWRRFAACLVLVILINMPWHFFRAWMPLYLKDYHKYPSAEVNYFTSAYYIATDVGCLAIGFFVRWLTARQWDVHKARLVAFLICSVLTGLGAVAAFLPAGYLLLGLLLVIGAGCLGLFPIYYSFTQDLASRNQGKITGTLSFLTWTISGFMHEAVGQHIKDTGSYQEPLIIVSLAPLAACVALLFLWKSPPKAANM